MQRRGQSVYLYLFIFSNGYALCLWKINWPLLSIDVPGCFAVAIERTVLCPSPLLYSSSLLSSSLSLSSNNQSSPCYLLASGDASSSASYLRNRILRARYFTIYSYPHTKIKIVINSCRFLRLVYHEIDNTIWRASHSFMVSFMDVLIMKNHTNISMYFFSNDRSRDSPRHLKLLYWTLLQKQLYISEYDIHLC